MAAGAILVLRPVLPAVRPFKTGAICLFVALVLASRPARSGSAPAARAVSWEPEWIKPRGGFAGEGLYYVTSTFLGTLGAHTIALFLLTAAVLLLTGASVAGVIKFTSDSVTTTSREVRSKVQQRRPATEELSALEQGPPPRVTAVARTFPEDEETLPDVLGEAVDLEPTVEDLRDEVPQLEELAEDPETDEPGVARTTPNPEDLTPQGRYRASVTDSPEFEWTLPDPAFLKRSTADASKPDTAGQEKVAAQLTEALGHFGIEAKVIGMVAGPAHHALRAAPRARASRSPRSPSSRTTSPTRWPPPTSASSPRSPASRRSASRSPTRAGGSSTSATCCRRRPRAGRRSRSGSARTSRAGRSAPTSRRCRTCSWPAPRARASRAASTRCSPPSSPARPRTSCGSCSSTPSRSSSTTTTRSRTCSRRSSRARARPPPRCRTSCARWSSATRTCRSRARAR